ncbi:MAG TPA: N-succinylarginine dihydrolase [Phycisphaeraceae bacterium]
MTRSAQEVNFDGLVGPTHNYAGLSLGNLASQRHRYSVSNPRAAALEGLAKMKLMMDLGLRQGVLPPQDRPDLRLLRRVGFEGADDQVLQQAQRDAPQLLAACYSASSMWAANAATVSPSADCRDGRVHFTPANLLSQLHRSIEPETTALVLRRIFADPACFAHHDPLPCAAHLRDEGAANHTRLAPRHDQPGVELFVYGVDALDASRPQPRRYPARQSLQASQAIARLHGLDPRYTCFVQQSPQAIDAGVFHNDVASVGHLDVFFYHTEAFVDAPAVIEHLRRAYESCAGSPLTTIPVEPRELSLDEAVESYVFNSQLVRLPDGTLAMICPEECRQHPKVQALLERLTTGGSIGVLRYVNLRQSMRNGGGPACLRLRVALTDQELQRVHPDVMLTPTLYDELVRWVERHYRSELAPNDLADPKLIQESRAALDELTRILQLGSIYPFQMA